MTFIDEIRKIGQSSKKNEILIEPIWILILLSFLLPIYKSFFLGLVLSQAAGITHEANHCNEKYKSFLFGNIIWGISNTKWNNEHKEHHKIVNSNGFNDPQFMLEPLFIQFKPNNSIIGKYQKIIFIPIVVFIGRINYQILSLIYILSNKLIYELIGIIFHFYIFYLILDNLNEWILMYITNGLTLHLLFIINHWTIEECNNYTILPKFGTEEYYKMQIKNTINYNVPYYLRWLFCGLDLHIEHHLYPNLRRNELISIKPLVENLCEKYNIEYKSECFITAFFNSILKMPD